MVPLDYGCGLDQYHGVQASWPNPAEPHPEQPICREQQKPTFVLAPQHANLMPKGNKIEFQRARLRRRKESAETKAEKIVIMPTTASASHLFAL